jgi:DNA-binding transcriptional LysR family regulator
MPDTEDIAIFVRVVELGSLTAAGRDMRLSVAVVSNRIARLESRLGTRLLNRTTRRVQPTPEGALFYEHGVVILNELDQAESAISERTDDPRGPIRVAVPAVFGRMHVAPHVPAFLQRYPNIQLRLHLSDQFVDLIQERMDLAIRIAELGDSNAIARKLAVNRRVIVGAPAYLLRHGRPEAPADLLRHNCLLLRFPGSKQFRWTMETPEGPQTLRVSGNMDSNNGEVLRQWCLAGQGLALKSLWEIADDLNAGRLEILLPDYPPPGHAIHALYPQNRFLSSRVRVFIDYLAEIYGPVPPWERGLKVKLPEVRVGATS